MNNLYVCETRMIDYIIASLKSMEVNGYDSYEKLVRCVTLLEENKKNKLERAEAKEDDSDGEKENG